MTSPGVHTKRLLSTARAIQGSVNSLGLSARQPLPNGVFDLFVSDTELRACTRSLYMTGHYAQAVEEAYKYVNNLVKSKSGLAADGAGLMRTAFSPNNPVLKINDLRSQSQKDQQQGYMDIFAGCMTGIRNPRAHEHRYLDTPDVAMEMLAWANHLIGIVNAATRV